ncbi:hypothetical protein B0G71_1870 [Paraburkholderia sp. BL27I4N3]|uniref:hypothetical protein n=1 Tax=Paraburkholderia sp. BL27I4N3 TaxID=1938805 RepID=UPI000E369D6A|nr:hypothetical protein [Paraburkholderia sp. BL27I4N3]REE18807.1 hypothetical protein B0G71_1870 [Paraburkholderia sp. BL27I4N3]
MPFILPSDWLSWSFGGGLSLILLWLISVPPGRDDFDDFDGVTSKLDKAHVARARRRIT